MTNISSFYNKILNIDNSDKEQAIKNIVLDEKKKLTNQVDYLDGFCKYIANQIKYQISTTLSGIHIYYLDMEEIVGVNHVSLIAEYMYNDNLIRLLIDPTFIQFVKSDTKKLLYLKEWPSDKIDDKSFINDLIENGVSFLDNERFNKYINSFSSISLEYNLDDYLMDDKIKNIK